MKFGGIGGMALSARFPVDADLSPFQAQINEAVKNALVRFGIIRETENGKFESTIGFLIGAGGISYEDKAKIYEKS